MSYKIYRAMSRPHQRLGELVDWEARVPSLHRRAHISGVFQRGGELLDPAEAPTALRIHDTVPATQHAFTSSGGIHVISRGLRDLFEEMDPGVHQFLPITVTDRKGQPFGEWFILNVGFRQDTAFDDPAEAGTVPDTEGRRGMMWLQDRTMTVDPAKQSGVNLWRETRFPDVCVISDQLHDELKRRGMKFFKAIKLKNRTE
ncbi:MAG: hypothetical protein E5X53_34500 [Mesorhizobium sp.]|uniref:imm11 family protein n=2 Tax=Mesorhizobium sp. TaxID=1871066 RepID=UPI000FE8F504|nr:DUF1629 domain-containing protein [Mesorhizobium sp.]RWM13573.1 MAG: hypothetical protein EOR73_28665 [Mesorhizobium sp.]TIP69143.1 MAG: hypothetical protein E5X55_33450 [Mesorhizobium sp.]TIQ05999.1 MAG: hypothetical protein E5X57_27445 [Mesorhizobium sp.]TIR47252.1 MAG: hypothetical protein E5X53_34500 [Mesorhizobium sp.]TJV90139.1 MAG: hypothetical protein E5X52_35110 [Mesorhizobium sp.]